MGQEVEADTLGDEFKVKTQFNWSWLEKFKTWNILSRFSDPPVQGYVLRITGGNDKQGFPMKQVGMVVGITPVQPRGDCFKNAGSPCRMILWVILSLILAGFSFLMLGTVRPKCLKIDFLCGFLRDFVNYMFWNTCHNFYNVLNRLIVKFLSYY